MLRLQKYSWLCYHLPENVYIHNALLTRATNAKEPGWQESKRLGGEQSCSLALIVSPLHSSESLTKVMKGINAESAMTSEHTLWKPPPRHRRKHWGPSLHHVLSSEGVQRLWSPLWYLNLLRGQWRQPAQFSWMDFRCLDHQHHSNPGKENT